MIAANRIRANVDDPRRNVKGREQSTVHENAVFDARKLRIAFKE
jgi:hypothetical protein